MQPNQQDPSQQNLPPAEPYNVPDYLHLDPISGQPHKSKKKLKLIALLILATLILAGAGVGAFVWSMGTPERRFYQALDNLMQTSYVNRQLNVKVNNASLISVGADSDFSTAIPKSKINYHYTKPSAEGSGSTGQSEFEGDIIALSDQEFTARLTQAPAGSLPKNAQLDKWYKVSAPTSTTTTNSATVYDRLKLRGTLNTSYGLVVVGNINSDSRRQVLESIKSNNIYTIQESHSETLDGKQATVYSVGIDYQKLTDLNDKIATLLNINKSNLIYSKNDKITFWIDDTTNQLVKLKQETKQSNTQQTVAEETFSYPAKLTITAPETATPLL